MSRATFYHPQLLEFDANIELSPEESVHAAKSRRLRVGQEIRLFNGLGLVANAELASISRNRVQVNVIACEQLEQNQKRISAFVAVPKGDRQRFMVDALCQLGITQITALNCEHSVTRPSEKIVSKWRRYAIEACKQSQNAWLPDITEERALEPCLMQRSDARTSLLYADLGGKWPVNTGATAGSADVFVGPEGGFSESEIQLFKAAGGTPVQLSRNILRIETAAIASTILISQ